MHFYLLGQIEPEKTGSMLGQRYNRYRGVTIRVITGFYCIKVNSGLKSTILNLTKLTFFRAYPPPPPNKILLFYPELSFKWPYWLKGDLRIVFTYFNTYSIYTDFSLSLMII